MIIYFYYLLSTFLGAIGILQDQVNRQMKKVLEAEAEKGEPHIYKGTFSLKMRNSLIDLIVNFLLQV